VCCAAAAAAAGTAGAAAAGVGVQLGGVSPQGGRLVEAPLVESPAEGAGIRRGDRVLEIGGHCRAALLFGRGHAASVTRAAAS
jgi:C-terminal processing protease CtpA/Prc